MASALETFLTRGVPGALSAAAAGDPAAVLNALGRSQIGRVEVRSQFSPPVIVNDPLAPAQGPPQEPNWILRLLRPEVRVYDPDGKLVVAVAPAGEPTENYLPYLIVGSIIFVVGTWVAGSFVISRLRRA